MNVGSNDTTKWLEILTQLTKSRCTQKIQTENILNYNQNFVNPIPQNHEQCETKRLMETQKETSDARDSMECETDPHEMTVRKSNAPYLCDCRGNKDINAL